MTRRRNTVNITANQLNAVREVRTVILPVAAMDSVFESAKAAVTTPMNPYPIQSVTKYCKKGYINNTVTIIIKPIKTEFYTLFKLAQFKLAGPVMTNRPR